ncbi:hypothetical protein SAMN05444123_105266 [Rhodopseudomonas pseudopalustris]|uniref:Uncharacterized protein n=1 Tax=Rhodopseudomonas pseudopalustris TaxID=1513892 RepID=A0A1H8T8Z0_9BRAD|nr:hypothetical protein SAMN05444123_105266 [Rhodopseudomonas pseudopalustris]
MAGPLAVVKVIEIAQALTRLPRNADARKAALAQH